MSGELPLDGDLDARMRRLFAGLDTAPGFESRVAARIAAMHPVTSKVLREQFERRRIRAQRQLRRDAWVNGVTAAGIGAAGIAVVWRNAPAVAHWVEEGAVLASEPAFSAALALAALAVAAWPALRRLMPR